MSTTLKVFTRINRMKRGTAFSISAFYSLGSNTAVQKAFSRLVAKGVVERVSKGIYTRPKALKSIPTIKVTANAEQVAKEWAKMNHFKLVSQGLEAAYKLGFQTQAPMKSIYWTNGPTRQFKVGNQVVEVRRRAESKLKWLGRPEGELLRGITVTPAQSVRLESLLAAINRLSLSTNEAKAVVRRLQNTPLTQAWHSKLRQLYRAIA